jgi:hypothetical protein
MDTFPKLGKLLNNVFTRFLNVCILDIFLNGYKTLSTRKDFKFVTFVMILTILKNVNI